MPIGKLRTGSIIVERQSRERLHAPTRIDRHPHRSDVWVHRVDPLPGDFANRSTRELLRGGHHEIAVIPRLHPAPSVQAGAGNPVVVVTPGPAVKKTARNSFCRQSVIDCLQHARLETRSFLPQVASQECGSCQRYCMVAEIVTSVLCPFLSGHRISLSTKRRSTTQ